MNSLLFPQHFSNKDATMQLPCYFCMLVGEGTKLGSVWLWTPQLLAEGSSPASYSSDVYLPFSFPFPSLKKVGMQRAWHLQSMQRACWWLTEACLETSASKDCPTIQDLWVKACDLSDWFPIKYNKAPIQGHVCIPLWIDVDFCTQTLWVSSVSLSSLLINKWTCKFNIDVKGISKSSTKFSSFCVVHIYMLLR